MPTVPLKLTQRPVCRQMQTHVCPWIGPTALPKVTALLESNTDIGYLACTLIDPSPFLGPQDHVLAAFVPQLEGMIRRHYQSSRGLPLVEIFPQPFISRLDAILAASLPSYVLLWKATERTVLQNRDGTTKKALVAFKALLLQNDVLGMT